ncbi:MipA/OmpV family protein [Pseudoalteromonas sp. JBTF-M23]|uniref:MipA/OmpV family protein n=1 Tax=Pseudoalteromonas caenipelagi TaxID=2726988 RepID=A0A849VI93_9GAMM|nr:MipA/OmpV family protein [Pseudoalteromonas caenipelagi]NOU51451.1 MipA/OmpV family protein [Pseudoalteromonas caenipelagi]
MKNKSVLLYICTSLGAVFVHADDTTNNEFDYFAKRQGGGYLAAEFSITKGASLYKKYNTLSLSLNGAYYFENGLFVEAPGKLNEFDSNFALGYNLFNTPDWEFDLLWSTAHGALGWKKSTRYLGLRASGEIAGLNVQAIIAPNADTDTYKNGQYASLWLSKDWQYKNWNFYGSFGAQYRNANMLDYYYGVPEGSSYFAPYEASGGTNLTYKMGFRKPFAENWLFEGSISYTQYAQSILDSSKTKTILKNHSNLNNYAASSSLSISYVF